MSDFSFASFWVFRPPLLGDPDIYLVSGLMSDDSGGTASDPTNAFNRFSENDRFDLNETITIDAPAGPNTALMFDGLIEIGGVDHPVFGDSYGNYYVFSQDSAQVAASIDVATIRETDAQGNSVSYAFPLCFAAGTGIATPGGDRAVETLGIGDAILTADGRVTEVKWLGVQTIAPSVAAQPGLMVRIAAGALGLGLPRRDLVVTSDHAMVLNGWLVTAAALVNGQTVDYVPPAEIATGLAVYHVETEAHQAILAEGAATETYIDYAGRSRFDNYDQYLALYGAPAPLPEMALPRVTSAARLPPVLRDRLAAPSGPDAKHAA